MEKVNKMTQIDTSKWKEFRIGDLFEIKLSKNDLKIEECNTGSTPLISAGNENNGIVGYINKENFEVFPANSITVDMFGKVFVQTKDFCAVSHGRVNILIPKYTLSLPTLIFIASVLQREIKDKFDFANMCTSKKISKQNLLLPIFFIGSPDWQFMEDYMKEITKLAAKRVEKLKEEKTQTKIDTSNWGEFRVGDLFEIKPTKSYKMRNADLLDGGNTPVVVNSAFNNGIGGFTTQEPTEKGGIITFSGTVDANTIFYQEKPFAGYSHVQGVYPVGEWANEWDKYSLLFFASCFKSTALRYGFDYSNKFRRDVALELKVLLPQTPDHTPDFDYMEDYMKEITELATKRVEQVTGENIETKTDTNTWKKFKVGELFDCETTKGIASKNDLVEGNIPYVTRSAENNGKSGYCGNADRIVKGNCITIGAEGFTAFYQENDFVAGNKVYTLRHRNLNNVNALYICTVLNKLSCLYSFNNARILDKIKQEVISLPIDNNGEPDWQYMEDYMNNIMEQAKKKLSNIPQ